MLTYSRELALKIFESANCLEDDSNRIILVAISQAVCSRAGKYYVVCSILVSSQIVDKVFLLHVQNYCKKKTLTFSTGYVAKFYKTWLLWYQIMRSNPFCFSQAGSSLWSTIANLVIWVCGLFNNAYCALNIRSY